MSGAGRSALTGRWGEALAAEYSRERRERERKWTKRLAALGGADAIVFTAGIGENDADVRESVATGLEYMGAKLDPEKNRARSGEPVREISAADSRVKILVIPTNEELVIARETREIVEKL